MEIMSTSEVADSLDCFFGYLGLLLDKGSNEYKAASKNAIFLIKYANQILEDKVEIIADEEAVQ